PRNHDRVEPVDPPVLELGVVHPTWSQRFPFGVINLRAPGELPRSGSDPIPRCGDTAVFMEALVKLLVVVGVPVVRDQPVPVLDNFLPWACQFESRRLAIDVEESLELLPFDVG